MSEPIPATPPSEPKKLEEPVKPGRSANHRLIGGGIIAGSLIGLILYEPLVMYAWQITLRVTAFLGIAVILGILAWIGYTMTTARPPEPIADIPEVGEGQKPDIAEQKA